MKRLFLHQSGLKSLLLFLLLGAAGMTKAFAQTQIGSQFYNNGFIYEVTQMTPNHCVTLIGWNEDNPPTGMLRFDARVSWDETYWKVTAIGDGAFEGYNDITAVEILYDVETIGNNAFKNCKGITSVAIQNLRTIGSNAFNGCTELAELYLDNINSELISIGDNAFEGCTKLTSVSIPHTVNSIGCYAFSQCTGLTSVTINNAPAVIDSWAFFNCGALATVDLGNAVTAINQFAFTNCTSLTSITLPNTLTTIQAQAFKNTGLTSVNIPASVNYIGHMAFASCPALQTITVDANNQTYDSRNDCNAIIEKGTNTLIVASRGTTVIPDGVEDVKGEAFYGCNPASVSIPSSMTSIGDNAFDHCGMTSVTIPSSVQSIGSSAFNRCENLTSVTIPNGVTTISSFAFRCCKSLNSITIPNSVTSIECYAFYACIALTSIEIPNSVTTIGEHAFHSAGLNSVTIPNSVTHVGEYAFSCCDNMTSAVLSNSLRVIPEHVFWSCPNMSSVTFPNAVERIEEKAFEFCYSLGPSLVIPNTVTYIGEFAFRDCKGLQSVVLGNSVEEIASGAFSGCFYLETITLHSTSVPQLDHVDAFAWANFHNKPQGVPDTEWSCNFYVLGNLVDEYKNANNWNLHNYKIHTYSLDTLNITFADANVKAICVAQAGWDTNGDNELSYAEAAAVTSIGTIFKGNTSIASFNELPYFKGVTSLDTEAFYGCTNLTSVELPKAMTTIGERAFDGCSKLVGIVIPNAVTTIGSYAFHGCTNMETVKIGSAVTNINDYAFYGCSKLLSITVLPTSVPTLAVTENETHAFDNTNECPIYVPSAKLGDYRNSWTKYENRIQPMDLDVADYPDVFVKGYNESTTSGWKFIASPLVANMNPTAITDLIADPAIDYDLYRFNQEADLEWENYKAHTGDFSLVNGQGYLYASKDDVDIVFQGTFNEDQTKTVELAYTASKQLAGWNLVGNPFPVDAYLNTSYYVMNDDGSAINPVAVSKEKSIDVCTGVMVKATAAGQSVVFSKTAPQMSTNRGNIQITVAQANVRGTGTAQDKAIVSFIEGDALEKFVFNKDNAKLYIQQDNTDYAIATAEPQGVMPLNFEAMENGTYTLTVSPEGVELSYLHLVDNLTGADIDLLHTEVSKSPVTSYTFTAKTTDLASRFRLVFESDGYGHPENSEAFAFISDDRIVVDGEGTLQVVDMAGRIILCTDVARSVSTAGMAPGVYVLRLINGNDVKTQKIVVE